VWPVRGWEERERVTKARMPPRSRDSQESRKKDASAGLRGIRGHHVILIACFFIAVGGMAVFHSSSNEQDDVYGTLLQVREEGGGKEGRKKMCI
jgi:hypothetical protein